MPETNVDSLPPTEYLVMDVLAARARLGEQCWTFPARLHHSIASLAGKGLLWWKHGIMPRTIQAFLTDEGRAAVLYEGYTTPVMAERERIRERVLALAGRWAQHSTSYDARAECADELRRLAREVLGQDGGA